MAAIGKGGCDCGELRVLILAGEQTEDRLDCCRPAKVDRRKSCRKCTLNKGAVYEDVYL